MTAVTNLLVPWQLMTLPPQQPGQKSVLDCWRGVPTLTVTTFPFTLLFMLQSTSHKKKLHPPLIDCQLLHKKETKQKFQQYIQKALNTALDDPDPPPPSEDAFHSVINNVEQTLLLGNPEHDKPWFVQSITTLTPLLEKCHRALLVVHDHTSESNKHAFCKAKNDLAAAVHVAKSDWAHTFAYNCMQYKTNQIKSWKAMRTLEKGLTHHHAKCCTLKMRKADGTKAVTDEENA
eukprot:15351644-Ditylum_brightwellii.AAC.1